MAADSVERLIGELMKLPGIGRRTAQRLTFYLMKVEREQAVALAKAIVAVKDKVHFCGRCFNATEGEICAICADPKRNRGIICVVEEPSDVMALEKTREYNGLYHVLGGHISPLDGVGPGDLHIQELMARLKDGVQEVILACNPTVEGQATSLYLSKLIEPSGVKVTRLALGLPMGGDLELADEVTLARALEGRRRIGPPD